MFKSTRANVSKEGGGGVSVFSKELEINNTFEVILDKSMDQSSEETQEEELEKEE